MSSIKEIVKKLHESRIKESSSDIYDLEDQIIQMYLNGDSPSEIAYNLNITRADVKVVVDDYLESRKRKDESSNSSDWRYWEMSKDHKGPFEYPHYYKEYTDDVHGYVFVPYESNIRGIDSSSDYQAELYSIMKDQIAPIKNFDNLEDAKDYLDSSAAEYLSKNPTNESKDGMTLEELKAEINKYVQNYNLDRRNYGQLFNILKYLKKNGVLRDEAKKIASDSEKELTREDYCTCGAKLNDNGECPACDHGEEDLKDSFDPNEDNAATVLDNIEAEIKEKVREFMMSPRCGFPEDEAEEYSRVSASIPGEDYIKVTVGAELSYEALSDLCDELNPIVAKYDKDSYFEPVEPGIISAYIY